MIQTIIGVKVIAYILNQDEIEPREVVVETLLPHMHFTSDFCQLLLEQALPEINDPKTI